MRFEPGGMVRIDFAGGRLHGDHNTLRILDTFSRPIRLNDAITALTASTPTYPAFRELMGQVMAMIDSGVIVADDGGAMTESELGTGDAHYGSLPVHIRMLDDRRRTEAFQETIRECVKPGDVVVDLGTGTGILAITAAQAGAAHVYAIERNPATADLARQMIAANGLDSRISVLQGSSFQVALPDKADVLVSEMLGNDPLEEDLRLTTEDAVRRLLKPDARLIPARVRLYGLPLSVPHSATRRAVVDPITARRWQRRYGVDFTPLARMSTDQDHRIRVNSYRTKKWPRLCEAVLLADLDLRQGFDSEILTTHEIAAVRTGPLTGILVYFDAEMAPDNWFSIAPDAASASNHWASVVWLPGRPINVERDDGFLLTYRYRDGRSEFEIKRAERS